MRVPVASRAVAMPSAAPRKRDPIMTRDRVLRAGIVQFCRHGYTGARIDQIAKRAGCNMRMIYHYFGSKEKLYLAVLERVFGELRLEESRLHLEHLDPVTGMLRLVEFTMNHLGRHPEFVALLGNENLLRGKYLRKSQVVPRASAPLLEAIRVLLERGRRDGVVFAGRRSIAALRQHPVAVLRARVEPLHAVDHLQSRRRRPRLGRRAARTRAANGARLPARRRAGHGAGGVSEIGARLR